MKTKTHTGTMIPETFVDKDGNHRSDRVFARTAAETSRLRYLADSIAPQREFTVMRNIVVSVKPTVRHELQAITVQCGSMREAGRLADEIKASRDLPLPRSRDDR